MPDTFTPNLNLDKPPVSAYDVFGAKFNSNLDIIDAASITLRGVPVSNTAPTINQILAFDGTQWVPTTNSDPVGPAGGSLAGTYPNPTIANSGVTAATYGDGTHVAQVAISADGRVTSASSVAITGAPPTGAAGGSLTGSYPTPTIAASGVTASTYGDSTHIPQIVVGADGRITSASVVAVAASGPTSTIYTISSSFISIPITAGVNYLVTMSATMGTTGTPQMYVNADLTPANYSYEGSEDLVAGINPLYVTSSAAGLPILGSSSTVGEFAATISVIPQGASGRAYATWESSAAGYGNNMKGTYSNPLSNPIASLQIYFPGSSTGKIVVTALG